MAASLARSTGEYSVKREFGQMGSYGLGPLRREPDPRASQVAGVPPGLDQPFLLQLDDVAIGGRCRGRDRKGRQRGDAITVAFDTKGEEDVPRRLAEQGGIEVSLAPPTFVVEVVRQGAQSGFAGGADRPEQIRVDQAP